jgi:hypothetical protein
MILISERSISKPNNDFQFYKAYFPEKKVNVFSPTLCSYAPSMESTTWITAEMIVDALDLIKEHWLTEG